MPTERRATVKPKVTAVDVPAEPPTPRAYRVLVSHGAYTVDDVVDLELTQHTLSLVSQGYLEPVF